MAECVVCHNEEVEDDDRPCMLCYYTGEYFNWSLRQDERAYMLERIESIAQVKRTAIFHHAEGNFQLAVSLTDGRILFLGAAMTVTQVSMEMTDAEPNMQMQKTKFVAPAIPPIGVPWGVAVMAADAESSEDVVIMEESFATDEELVNGLKQVITLNALIEES